MHKAALAGVLPDSCGLGGQNIQVDSRALRSLPSYGTAHLRMDPESKLPLLSTETKNSLKHLKINIAANFTVLPECEFGFEDSLSLQTSSLSYEQVVVVSLQRRFVNVKHFIPQVEGHAEKKVHLKKIKTLYLVYSVQTVKPITHTPSIRPFDNAGVALSCFVSLLIPFGSPPNRIFHLQQESRQSA